MTQNKCSVFLSLCILLFCLMLSGVFFTSRTENENAPTAENNGIPVYVLGEYNGYVSLFYGGGSSVPVKIYETCVASLPEADRKRLREGIGIYDETELFRLVEDYTG